MREQKGQRNQELIALQKSNLLLMLIKGRAGLKGEILALAGIQIVQRSIITRQGLQDGDKILKNFFKDFEALYYQRKKSHIHFIHHGIHLLTHIAPETVWAGPPACYVQRTMEMAIGNLGREIRQNKDFFQNLEERGVL